MVYAVVLRNGEKKMLTVTLRPRKKPELVGHLYKMPSGEDKIRESEKIGIRNLRALSVCPAALETVRSSCLAYAALFNKPAGTDGFGVYYFDSCGEILVLYKKGDILITERTSSKGITGHVAIYIGNGKVLHTSGWKSEPHPKVMTIKKWSKR